MTETATINETAIRKAIITYVGIPAGDPERYINDQIAYYADHYKGGAAAVAQRLQLYRTELEKRVTLPEVLMQFAARAAYVHGSGLDILATQSARNLATAINLGGDVIEHVFRKAAYDAGDRRRR